jgi:hypothetical protein
MNGQFGVLSSFLGSTDPLITHKPLDILLNTINYTLGGIRLEASNREKFAINNNYIYGPTPSAPGLPTGIIITTPMLNSNNAPQFDINFNSIYEGQCGIQITSTTIGTSMLPYTNYITRNGIYSENTGRTGFRGISILRSNSIQIRCNLMKGIPTYVPSSTPSSPMATANNRGIFLSASVNNWISTNTMNDLNVGFSYTGNCLMPQMLAGNLFQNLNFHIQTDISALNQLGNQGIIAGTPARFAANQMNNIITISGASVSNGGVAFQYGSRLAPPTFYPPSCGSFTAGTVTFPTGVPVTNYSEPAATLCGVPLYDATYALPPEGSSGLMNMDESGRSTQDFALEVNQSVESIFDEAEEGVKKMNEELLYDLVKTDSSLLLNDTLLAFYNEKNTEHLGELDAIKDLISSKENSEADDKISALPISNEAEEVNKIVFEIFNQVTQKDNYKLTDEEIDVLLSIAEYCPIRYGPAVYSARVLINTQYGYEALYWDDEDLCISGIDYRKSNLNSPSKEISSTNDFAIFPNPTSSELNFKMQNTIGCKNGVNTKIEIYDLLGNMVLKKEYLGSVPFGKIDISILANGVFLFKYSCSSNEIYRKSFVVNK